MLTVGSLFSGIGGFDLGLERAGMKVIWQSEIDPYASAVLRKHWPEVPNHGDIRSVRVGAVERPDVLAGGFPCQDISVAGKGAGIDGERSGLWSEYARVIGELRPRYVIVENVAALLGRGLGRVLGDLASLGFDAEWHCIPACAIGATHTRDRLFLVAHAHGECEPQLEQTWRSLSVTDKQGFSMYDDRSAGPWLALEPRPDDRREDDGVSGELDRLRCLGNAIVPQIAEIIGRAIVSAHHAA